MQSLRTQVGRLHPKRWPDLLNRIEHPRRRLLLMRIKYLSWRFRAPVEVSIPRGVIIGKRVNVELRRRTSTKFSIGAGSTIGDDVRLRLRGGEVRIGERVDLRATCIINVTGGLLVLDGPSNVGWGTAIHCAESVTIAKFAQLAEYSTIVDSNHVYTAPDEWSYLTTVNRPIELGVDVWVCPKSTITGGVTIGDHTIVGPSTVVTKDVPSGVLVSGIPGKVIKELDLPWKVRPVEQTELA